MPIVPASSTCRGAGRRHGEPGNLCRDAKYVDSSLAGVVGGYERAAIVLGLHWIRRPPPSYSAAVAPPSYTAAKQQAPRGGDAGQQAGPSAETLAERARFLALSAPSSSSTAPSPRHLGEQPLIAGEVQKKGSGLFKSWSKRCAAMFDSFNTMIYFNNQP